MENTRKLFLFLFKVGFIVGALSISERVHKKAIGDARIDSNLFRLPNETRPISYDITLGTRFDQGDMNVAGRVKIVIEVMNQTSEIVVNARNLEISSISLSTANRIPTAIAVTHSYDESTEFLTVALTQGVLNQGLYILLIEYAFELRTDGAGFFYSTYTDKDSNIDGYAATLFKLTDARLAFPCYDDPAKKAIFKIAIKHASDYKAISNMPIKGEPTNNGDGTVTTRFQQTTLMSTYLIAFAIFNFEYSELNRRIPHRIYSQNGTEINRNFPLTISEWTMKAIEDYLGVKYVLPKIDHLALPNFPAYGIENYGLPIYREEALLLDYQHMTVESQNSIFQFVSHEIGHQWFGNFVSPKWYTFLWLSEGFASLFSYIAADMVYPEWNYWQRFHVAEFQRSLELDGRGSSKQMSYDIESLYEISFVIYSKAASVINMFKHALTEAVFLKGLNYYLNDMQYAAAEEDDLLRNLERAVNEYEPFGNMKVNVFQMIKSWTNQPGFPLITVTRDYTEGTFVVTQSPFDKNSASDTRSWWVPFNIATAKNPHFRETTMHDWLNVGEESKEVSPSTAVNWDNDDWIILNKRSTSYYRINYDLHNWKLLASALTTYPLQFHVHNRAQLLDDGYAFVQSNRMNFATFLDLSVYLKQETEYSPWYTANSFLTEINQYLSADIDYDLFQYYVGKIVANFYSELGFTEKYNDGQLTKLTRSYAINWACQANLRKCLQETSLRLKYFVQLGVDVEPDLRSSIFCNGLRNAGEAEHKYMLNELMTSKSQAYRSLLLNEVLGCIRNVPVLTQYLYSSLRYDDSNTYRDEERIYVLLGIVNKGPIQLGVAIDFLIVNHVEYSKLAMEYGSIPPLLSAVRRIANRVVTEEQNTKFEMLLKVLNNYEEIRNAANSLRATVKANQDWVSTYRAEVIDWLRRFKEKDGGGDGGDGASINIWSPLVLFLMSVICYIF